MTIGGTDTRAALAALTNMMAGAVPIALAEYRSRIARAQAYMEAHGIAATYLNAGSNLTYFTGTRWSPSERMVGAVLPARGELIYIAPAFEEHTIRNFMEVEGDIACWDEHENPALLLRDLLDKSGVAAGGATLVVDESTPLFLFDAIRAATPGYVVHSAHEVTSHCRMRKSSAEIALIQRAMDMTMAVHKAAASILAEGITTADVEEFIHRAHRKVGASGSYFCIVLFGEATSYPHGVNYVQTLGRGDTVLIDTGCKVHNYISDITRTYVFGEPSARSASCGTRNRRRSARRSRPHGRASHAKTWTRRPAARSKRTASGRATSCPGCRTGPAMASASTSTKAPTSSAANAVRSNRACASRTSR
jgi:Xaa-Pro dipeptidase